jgi:rod shape-determining protein MreD
MARWIIAAVLVTFVIAVFQASLGGELAVWGVAPDLLLVWTICTGLLSGRHAGAAAGFGSGAIEGALQQSSIGALAISKAISGLLAGLLAAKMFKENWLVPAICAAVLTVSNEVVFVLLSGPGDWTRGGRVVAVRVVYHAVLAPIAFAATVRAWRAILGWRAEAV